MNHRLAPRVLAVCGLAFPAGCAASDHGVSETKDIVVADGQDALALLIEGNERFVAGKPRHSHESPRRRAMVAGRQHPFAVILGCADSRVPPEIIFDVGLGDTFVIRVAGNLAGPYEAGSIEYAIEHLGTPLVLVLGHEGCGAVTAAFGAFDPHTPVELVGLLELVSEALVDIDPSLPIEARIHLGVEANVRHSVDQLKQIADRIDNPQENRATIVGGVYELETGRVRMIDLE